MPVIYYARDPAGRRVEVPVTQQQHQQIQAAGGWRQSGAEAQAQQQVSEAYSKIQEQKEIQAPSGRVPKPVTEQEVAREVAKTKLPLRPEIVEKYAVTELPLRPEIVERYRPEPRPEPLPRPSEIIKVPPRAEIREPPEMRPDIHVTAPTPFTKFEAEPKAILRPERVYEKPPPRDVAEAIFEFAAPLLPTRTEREIAYPSPRVGITPIIEFGRGIAYGAITFPATIIKMPETIYTAVTDPVGTITAIGKKFQISPGFFVGEITGQAAISYGVGKLISTGIGKIRARAITTETQVGQYTFDPSTGFGKVGVDIVIKKKGKIIDLAQAEIGFKTFPKEIFKPSPFLAKVTTGIGTKKIGMAYVLGKGEVLGKITAPSGLSVTTAKAMGLMYKYPGFKRIAGTIGISETLAQPTGFLQTVGLGVTKTKLGLAGQKFVSYLFRRDITKTPITRIITKPTTKTTLPAVVGVQTKVVESIVKAGVTKPSPIITRAGVLTGAVSAFIAQKPPIVKEIIEEEYISPKAPRVVGVPALDIRQREATMQRFGLTQKSALRTMQRLGVGKVLKPMERMDIAQKPIQLPKIVPIQRPVTRLVPRVIQKPRLKLKLMLEQKLKTELGLAPPITVPIPVTKTLVVPPIFVPMPKKPLRRRRRKKPKFKYREIRHPFPTIRELIGA